MDKTCYVAVVEDDPFARNWMAQILARDWRTRLVGEAEDLPSLVAQMKSKAQRIDLIVLDIDLPHSIVSQLHLGDEVVKLPRTPRLLCTGIRAEARAFQWLGAPYVCGYVLKDELKYSLNWAVALASQGYWVTTPGVQSAAERVGFELPERSVLVDGRQPAFVLTGHQAEVARLALIFSLGRRELADELNISEDWSYGMVSAVYKKLGLDEILSGETDIAASLEGRGPVVEQLAILRDRFGTSRKTHDLETLAFHLLTAPEAFEIK